MFMFEELDLILPESPFDGAMQMALDEVLLATQSRPTLRIYRWSAPWVSFGYFQKIDEVGKAYPEWPVVRRWTGGGIVEHGTDLTFSLIIPRDHPATKLPPSGFYSRLHGALAGGLSRILGSKVGLTGEGEVVAGDACFSAPAQDDILLNGRKILGGAQRRSAGALLYQGSLQGVQMTEKKPALIDVISRSISARVLPSALEGTIRDDSAVLADHRYRSQAWNHRR